MSPRLYYRDPETTEMIPITIGSASGSDEVAVSATEPTGGEELWMDTTFNKLKYRNPLTGLFVDVPVDAGSAAIDGNIRAGSGLTGGGLQSTSPTLNVGQGAGITVSADAVAVNKGTLDTWYAPVNGQAAVQITNWNSAVLNNTAYMGYNASNSPDVGWYFGTCVSYSALYKHQVVWPFGNARWHSGQMWEREMENGVWGSWNRSQTYYFSRDQTDAYTFIFHNGSESDDGTRRYAYGMGKDRATNAPSANDAFRIVCYDLNGTYTWNAIYITENGIVQMPKGYSLVKERMAAGEPIVRDAAATIGNVVDIVMALLERAGITVDPVEVISLMEGQTE